MCSRRCRCSASPTCTTRSPSDSEAQTPGERAGALELLLEALYLERRISKDSADGETVYG